MFASFTASRINSEHYNFTDLVYADVAAIFMSDQLQVDSVLQVFNAFAAPLGLSWPKTKLQNVGEGNPPSTILIDGVPVEGVHLYLAESRVLMFTADRMFYARLDMPVH